MMTAAVYQDTIETFNKFNPNAIIPGGRFVAPNYRFNKVASAYQSVGQGIIISSVTADALINQARSLRRRHFWRIWGLRAPDKRVIDTTISVIRYCPSGFLLDGYSVENYGNGTVVMIKRSPNFMTTINIGRSALSYAKLSIKDHKIVASGKCGIEENSVAELFKAL